MRVLYGFKGFGLKGLRVWEPGDLIKGIFVEILIFWGCKPSVSSLVS